MKRETRINNCDICHSNSNVFTPRALQILTYFLTYTYMRWSNTAWSTFRVINEMIAGRDRLHACVKDRWTMNIELELWDREMERHEGRELHWRQSWNILGCIKPIQTTHDDYRPAVWPPTSSNAVYTDNTASHCVRACVWLAIAAAI